MKPYPKHKPSGIQWLGDIPSHWEVKSFKRIWKKENRPVRDEDDVVTAFRDGMVTLRKNRREDGFTFAVQEFGYQGIRKNDLVIHGMDAFAGAIGVSDSDGKSSPVYQVCTPRDEANPYYYALLFREMSRNGYILSLARGIRERSTDFKYNEFGKLPLPLPPITEQHAIAAFLDRKTKEIDSFLETKKNLIAVLKEQKAAIINDAVTGKYNSALRHARLDAAAQGDNKTKPSGIEWLGDIPSHWEVKKVKHLSILQSGKSITSEQINETGDYPVYGGNGIRGYYTKYTNDGDYILIGRQGALCGNINYASGKFWASEHAVVVYLKDNVNLKWFGETLRVMNLNQYSESAAQPGLAVDTIKRLYLPLPPLHEQHAIVAHIEKEIERIDYIIQQTEKEMELMKEYKQALISEAVTGKIRVE